MALEKTVTLIDNFKEAVVFRNAYIRVESISGSKNKLDVTVSTYKKANELKLATEYFSFAPVLDQSNFIAQAYEHLKSLPEFADAVDC
jgi:hypothetical protein